MEDPDRLKELKELKKEKRYYIYEYHKAKASVVGYSLLCSLMLSGIASIIAGFNPFSYKTDKNVYYIENVDSTGDKELYYTTEVIRAIDSIEVNVYTDWNIENGYYVRHKETYILDNTDELKNKILQGINNITQEDLDGIQYIKKSGFLQYAEKLDEETLNKGAYVSMTTSRLGEKITCNQTFDENLVDYGIFGLLSIVLYIFLKEILADSSEEYIECIIDEYDEVQDEINKLIDEENVRKKLK